MDFSKTLNLPKTAFPMKANLADAEPKRLEAWQSGHTYERMLELRKNAPAFILHDGPPYANGHIHFGTVLNKILKDIIVKQRALSGRLAFYRPGWDCHGLPIESQADKDLKKAHKNPDTVEKRAFCRDYASRFVAIQRQEFERLGVFGLFKAPYLTMSPDYEAKTLEVLYNIYDTGAIYRDKKPVFWCITCKTALAEAEVEYEPHESPGLYARLLVTNKEAIGLSPDIHTLGLAVFTTTPWTLLANLAVCYNPKAPYLLLKKGTDALILASERFERLKERLEGYEPLKELAPEALRPLRYALPFGRGEGVLLPGEHVTLDMGTGLVHTAPGHGEEDYLAGKAFGLEPFSPVDESGLFTDEAAAFVGKHVFEANGPIVQDLASRELLLFEEPAVHSYPHCWRCKKPVIFRATRQWFISMEKTGLRNHALEALDTIAWVPPWGKDRMLGMLKNRPDWCISRQRSWGVPIAFYLCNACDEVYADPTFREHTKELFLKEGADTWFKRPDSDFLPNGASCPKCGSERLRKETDILDVWFDSGMSHAYVSEVLKDFQLPADLYLEGSDQHRGWFHSSLLIALLRKGTPPYRAVLTHGFVVDEKGRKMSKSLGNVLDPNVLIKQHGAEILRLWTSYEDYKNDIRVSDTIISQLVDVYRRIRNTCRFLLANLYDFDPAKDACAHETLPLTERFMLKKLSTLAGDLKEAYETYEFHAVIQQLHQFCALDLSAFYLDISKDALYCLHPAHPKRRAIQTVLYETLEALMPMMAPILSFTAEEVFEHVPYRSPGRRDIHAPPVHAQSPPNDPPTQDTSVPAIGDGPTGVSASPITQPRDRRDILVPPIDAQSPPNDPPTQNTFVPTGGPGPASVFFLDFPAPKDVPLEEGELAAFKAWLDLRTHALKALEMARKEKGLKSNLDAILAIELPKGFPLPKTLPDGFAPLFEELFITSGVLLGQPAKALGEPLVTHRPEAQGGLVVHVLRSPHPKCERCWKHKPEVGKAHSSLMVCARCLEELSQVGLP